MSEMFSWGGTGRTAVATGLVGVAVTMGPMAASAEASQFPPAASIGTPDLSPETAVQAIDARGNVVLDTQRKLAKLALPVGSIDGKWGGQTAQGLCAFRYIAGLPVSRGALTQADVTTLNKFATSYKTLEQIPAPKVNGAATNLVAQLSCQVMLYAKNGRYNKVIPISSGAAGHDTPRGTFRLGSAALGWTCSNLYPSSCGWNTQGKYAKTWVKGAPYSKWGNMYNMRHVTGAIFVHGSSSVPLYAASHGCIRVTPKDADWLATAVANPPIKITGNARN